MSAFNALTLSPALSASCCARQRRRGDRWRLFGVSTRLRLVHARPICRGSRCSCGGPFCHAWRSGPSTPGPTASSRSFPAGFLPDEDQGAIFVSGASSGWCLAGTHERSSGGIEEIAEAGACDRNVLTLGGLDLIAVDEQHRTWGPLMAILSAVGEAGVAESAGRCILGNGNTTVS